MAVVEGDQETLLDAERIRATGCPVVQINTGRAATSMPRCCGAPLTSSPRRPGSLLFVENVGNLVCPALFDLGERAGWWSSRSPRARTSRSSTRTCSAPPTWCCVNKVDLLPYVDFDPELCAERIRRINPTTQVLLVSATTGEGLAAWYAWLGTPAPPVDVAPTASTVMIAVIIVTVGLALRYGGTMPNSTMSDGCGRRSP